MERVAAVKWHEDAHHFLIRLASRLLESFARLPHLLSDRFSLPLDSKILLLQVCLDLTLLFGVHIPDLLLTDTHESAGKLSRESVLTSMLATDSYGAQRRQNGLPDDNSVKENEPGFRRRTPSSLFRTAWTRSPVPWTGSSADLSDVKRSSGSEMMSLREGGKVRMCS